MSAARAPAPGWLPRVARLEDGASVELRLLRPDDEPALRRAFDALSSESRYRRFHGHVPRLSDAAWRYLCRVDDHDHVALVAVTAAGGIVAVARFVRLRERSSEAELAVTIADAWQSRGLGSLMTCALADVALARGVTTLRAHVLPGEAAIERIVSRLGQTTSRRDEREVVLDVHLRGAVHSRE